MSMLSNVTNIVLEVRITDIVIPTIGRFWLFLVSNILSLLCCFFVLFHFLFVRTLRDGLSNHVFIVILCMCIIWELTVAPFAMHLYLYGIVWLQNPTFCLIWKFLDSCIYTTIAKLVAWASVERHILIFNNQWMLTRKKRIFIHYIPLFIIVIYGFILYGIITPINDCNRAFYYMAAYCGYYSCIYNSNAYSLYEFASGGVLSSFLIATGSISLVLRVISQKRRLLLQQNQWRKHRKMVLQLASITLLFYIIYLPPILLAIAKKCGVPSSVGADYSLYAQFFSDYIIFLFPFACMSTLPQLRDRIKNIFRCCYHGQRRIVPLQQ